MAASLDTSQTDEADVSLLLHNKNNTEYKNHVTWQNHGRCVWNMSSM